MRESRSGQAKPDQGMGVIELVTAMAIFSVVLVVFIGGLISMARTTARATSVADASDDLRRTFHALDKQVRYSSSINRPGTGSSGSWYVEFVATALPDGQESLCTQWRFDPTAQTLAYRTWRDVSVATVSDWKVVAYDLTNDIAGGDLPFVFDAAGGVYNRQRLTVSMQVTADSGPAGEVKSDVETVFVARNSSYLSPSNPDLDSDGISDTPVCASHLDRP